MDDKSDIATGPGFLTPLQIKNKEEILNAFQGTSLESLSEEDKQVFNHLFDSLKKGDWSLLTPQELRFLREDQKKDWVDYLLFRWKFKNYPTLKKFPPFPLYLLIEPTSICNLKCRMCYQSDESFSKEKSFMGKMEFQLFKKIIDEAATKGTRSITLASRGEPTLHSDFPKMLNYCSKKFFELKINTNALLLNDDSIHSILSNAVDIVVFSVDAYNESMYKDIRRSSQFGKVVDNIKKFKFIRDEHYPNSHLVTRAHAIMVEKDFDQQKFLTFWQNHVDEVTHQKCITRWDIYNEKKSEIKRSCLSGLDRLYIWHDGTCNPCDADYKSCLSFGNAKTSTIQSLWSNSLIHSFRSKHINGQRDELYPCDRCEL